MRKHRLWCADSGELAPDGVIRVLPFRRRCGSSALTAKFRFHLSKKLLVEVKLDLVPDFLKFAHLPHPGVIPTTEFIPQRRPCFIEFREL